MLRLIVNADDLGLAPQVDRGIERAAAEGVVTSATLMVTLPGARSGARSARRLGGARRADGAPAVSVGLHVDLVTGRPVSAAAAASPLAGPGGGFHHDAARRAAALEDPAMVPIVMAEVEAQAARFEALVGAPPSHLDSHKHTHRDHPAVRGAIAAVARRLGVPARAQRDDVRDALRRAGVATPDAFVGDVGVEPYWTVDRLLAMPAGLAPGTTELMCHPGEPMGPVPGLFYVAQRQAELEALLDPRVPRALQARGVRLVSFADLTSCR